ncbi:hypothetical protein Psuf_011390 [Phytohabitans suffuscus]|uniref:Uncharacterized protein n=1 Tax=Phytohabitans suffuscus TaxID=624315 RepID=A0A6F8YCK2_9ACTN|nr:hypothetical protein Psuf_011390 [Phytohabitans suffuscus]
MPPLDPADVRLLNIFASRDTLTAELAGLCRLRERVATEA